ncbi:hypothetical protein F5B22DRAFT_605678 [Xylaria bambusicola]|uniref:uncharacterized protein n=1 Tax=Xylaria bambusicola TaxID=326684 RepID=UPI0020073EA7|nr:uncharacterized protein F5B22DRAFT_605678 [Xylaria bambusicola]KAI0516957.1 hypothetical protein F5B22DRAFT_605678 [Xylaria bambusicola]
MVYVIYDIYNYSDDMIKIRSLDYHLKFEAIVRYGRGQETEEQRSRYYSTAELPDIAVISRHGQLDEYRLGVDTDLRAITFSCPRHGDYTIHLSRREEVTRLEADSTVRALLRTMAHLVDASVHNIRVTSPSKAGIYQETLLYRPLAAWSASTGLANGRTPHILYYPLITN